MADPNNFAPDNQVGHYPQQTDTSGYYPDDQRDYQQSGYERQEYLSGHTEDIHYASEGSTYGAGPVHGSQDNYNQGYNYQQQQQQQYSDHDGYSSPGYSSPGYGPPPDAYPLPTSPTYSSEHDYSGYYPPPSGQPSDVYYKSDGYDPHGSVDNYQKPQFDVYSDFNNNVSPPHDLEPSDAHTSPTYASSTPFKEHTDLSDPLRLSIAAAPLPKKQRRRCCRCCRCCTWKVCVITTFIILVILAAVGFFVFPRVPKVSVVQTTATGGGLISTTRVNITLGLRVRVDNQENWIPFHFNKIEVTINSRDDETKVGFGKLVDYKLSPRKISFVTLPLRIYHWGNTTDAVMQDFISACGASDQERTSLNLNAVLKLFIWGIDWAYKPTIKTGANNLECPYQLPVGDLPQG